MPSRPVCLTETAERALKNIMRQLRETVPPGIKVTVSGVIENALIEKEKQLEKEKQHK